MSKIINKCFAMSDTYNHYCIFALRLDSKKYKLTGTLSEYQTINDVTFDGNASTSFRVAFKQLELLMGYIVIDENGYVYGTKIPFIKVPP